RTRNRRQSAQGGDQSFRFRGGERRGPGSGVQAVGRRDRGQEKAAQPRGGIPGLGSRRQPCRPFAARMAALSETPARAKGISYFAFLTSPFFTPASGKPHIAATMNTAVTITNIESPGRIGEPLQNASTAATISATTETPALTSVGTAIAPCLQLA